MDSTLINAEQFEILLRTINVKDFGDFRRKLNSYVCRMQEVYTSPSQRRVLAQMKVYLNFEPNWKIEESRRQLLNFNSQLKANNPV